MKLSDLKPNEGQIEGVPSNPRTITEDDFEKLKKSLVNFRKMLSLRPMVVDEDWNILGGNMRYLALCRLRDEGVEGFTDDIPDEWVKQDITLSAAEKREFIIKDNQQRGRNDWDALANEWDDEELREWDVEAAEWGADAESEDDSKQVDEDDFDENKDAVQTVCKQGDVWQLGVHRLMCGDSTDEKQVATLMGGKLADLWITDPPYNVSVKNSQGMTIANDNMDSGEFSKFLTDAFSVAVLVMSKGCPFYVWFASCEHINFEKSLNRAGLRVRQELIWNKNQFILGRSHYQWKHEPCLYGWKGDSCKYFTDSRSQSSVISDSNEMNFDKMKKVEMRELLKQIFSEKVSTTVINENKPTKDAEHPTMKPVKLFGLLICNSSNKGDIVLDTFGGSGTTIIACEQLGRKARIMELDPHYCDVIIARWEKLTGEKAVLINRETNE